LLGGKGLRENSYRERVWALGYIKMHDFSLVACLFYWEVLKIYAILSLNIENKVQYLNVNNQTSATAIFSQGLNLAYSQMLYLTNNSKLLYVSKPQITTVFSLYFNFIHLNVPFPNLNISCIQYTPYVACSPAEVS
jgi:hypothetical protein